jgi:transposase
MTANKQTKIRRTRMEWAKHLAAWQQSGLTQGEYCKKHNLKPTLFSAWKRKIKEHDEARPFVEIPPWHEAQPVGDEIIELKLEGIRIRLREGIDPIRLRNIVIALAGV